MRVEMLLCANSVKPFTVSTADKSFATSASIDGTFSISAATMTRSITRHTLHMQMPAPAGLAAKPKHDSAYTCWLYNHAMHHTLHMILRVHQSMACKVLLPAYGQQQHNHRSAVLSESLSCMINAHLRAT